MNIEIIERNYQASDHLKRIVEQKLEKLDKYFDGPDTKCKVYFKKENISLKTEVMLEYQGRIVRAQEISDNFYDNIDKVLPKIEGQIRKYRTKFDKAQKNNAFKEQRVYEPEEEIRPAKEGIVKEKRFKLKPMLVEEAVEAARAAAVEGDVVVLSPACAAATAVPRITGAPLIGCVRCSRHLPFSSIKI